MVNFMEDNADSEIYSNELKKQAGFGKDGEKGFDGAITNLMMQTYLCNCDFKKRVNKRGIEYGWDVAVYSSIELNTLQHPIHIQYLFYSLSF